MTLNTQRPEDVHSYSSKPFDILCEREGWQRYKMTVINNSTKEPVEEVNEIPYEDLGDKREELIMKWLINLAS